MSKSKSLITLLKPSSLISESYKMFRANLSYMNVDTDNKVILFTSSAAEEGKTTTICNAAVEFARAGYKTLLIECDLRKARVHNIFELPQSPGLVNVLIHGDQIEDITYKIEGVDKLQVMTAGPLPPSPVEILESNKMGDLIQEARKSYDKVLIDAPPVLSVTDAAILSKLVDGVVIIAASNATRKDVLLKAKQQLDKVGAKALGVVLTKVDLRHSSSYYGYKSYYIHEEQSGFKRLFRKYKNRGKGVDYLDDEGVKEAEQINVDHSGPNS